MIMGRRESGSESRSRSRSRSRSGSRYQHKTDGNNLSAEAATDEVNSDAGDDEPYYVTLSRSELI
ncbi:GH17536 [Drosophila grimshawi]|uniref:GH17536 n=1 Tax=Drosophila grimshawi TaxID=7222 RepID=B4K084_DROGR|nr:GH17536 [Drosophila grimshawi]